MAEFYIIIALKIFFPNFRGHVPPSPVSYAYGGLWEMHETNASMEDNTTFSGSIDIYTERIERWNDDVWCQDAAAAPDEL